MLIITCWDLLMVYTQAISNDGKWQAYYAEFFHFRDISMWMHLHASDKLTVPNIQFLLIYFHIINVNAYM